MSKQWKRDLFAINVHGNAYNVGDEIEFRIWESTDGKTNISVDGEVLDAEKIAEIGQGGGGGEVIENIEEALDFVSNQLTPYDITDVVDYWPSDGCGVQPESPWGPVDWEVEYSVQGQTVVEYKLPNTLIYDNAIFTQTYTGSEFTHFIDPDGKVEITIIHNDQTEQDYIYAIDNYNDYWADFVTDSDFLTTRGFHDIVINSPSSDYADAYVEDHGTTWKCWIEDFNVELTYDRNAEIWKGIAEDEYATEVVFNIWDDVTLDDDTIIFQGDFDLRNKLGYCYTPLIDMAQNDELEGGYSSIPSWEIVEGSNELGEIIDCETMMDFCDLPYNMASMDDIVRGYFDINYDAWYNLDPSTESPQEIGAFRYKDEYGTIHNYIVYFQQDPDADPIEIEDIQNDTTRNYVSSILTFVAAPGPEPTDTTVDLGEFSIYDTFNGAIRYPYPAYDDQYNLVQPDFLFEFDLNDKIEELCGDLSRGIQFLSNKFITAQLGFADNYNVSYGAVPVLKKENGFVTLMLDDVPNNDLYSHYQAQILVEITHEEDVDEYNYYLIFFNDTVNIMPEATMDDVSLFTTHKFLGQIQLSQSSLVESTPAILYEYTIQCLLRNMHFVGYDMRYNHKYQWECGKGESTIVKLPYYCFESGEHEFNWSETIPMKFSYVEGQADEEPEGDPFTIYIIYYIDFAEYVLIDSYFTLDRYLNYNADRSDWLWWEHKHALPIVVWENPETQNARYREFRYISGSQYYSGDQYYVSSTYNSTSSKLIFFLLRIYQSSNTWAYSIKEFEGINEAELE